jgi:maltooligosyltrehalose trehalohydrolase
MAHSPDAVQHRHPAPAPSPGEARRRLGVGAEVLADGGVHFRVWAPRRRQVILVCQMGSGHVLALPLRPEGQGYFSRRVRELGPGVRYGYRLDDGARTYPDPGSAFQPDGPAGLSEVIDPAFPWTDAAWPGCALRGQVLYELHLGTFTPEGTWDAARARLADLAALGVTAVCIMPIGDFPGAFGWGYDGVNLFAPSRLYGRPETMRAFVDAAHAHGIGVILDVVYNHFGPSENWLGEFSGRYVTRAYATEWGEPLNFDGPDAAPVRAFVLANVRQWIERYHVDGLRLDATQALFDASPVHIIRDIVTTARAAGGHRRVLVIGENEPQQSQVMRPAAHGGFGVDALWNDDFHHSVKVALTGFCEAYYSQTRGTPQELVSALRWGYLYQGQRYDWQKKRRGSYSFDLPAEKFVHYLENHDQVANSGGGRLGQATTGGRLRAATCLLLLGPATPLLFQGQELGSTRPFYYFADHADPTLARQVREGRSGFLAQFPNLAGDNAAILIPDPADPATFATCKLDWGERQTHAPLWALHRDLLRLRRDDPVFAAQRTDILHGAVLGPEAFVLRWLGPDADDRLLVVNLGRAVDLHPAPEPLLAPPRAGAWRTLWSTDALCYGGPGEQTLDTEDNWHLPGHAAYVLTPSRG